MGSDVVTSTVNHAGSPTHADDPSVHSSTESETSKKSETMVSPLPQSISNGPLPDFYQSRLDKRSSLAKNPAELPLPGIKCLLRNILIYFLLIFSASSVVIFNFDYSLFPGFALKKADGEDSSVGGFNDVPTPPSSPRFKTSFHDRMKALDEKFEKISSVSVGMSQIKNRSASLSEDKISPPRRVEPFVGSNTSPLLIKTEPFERKSLALDGGSSGQDGLGQPLVSNIARYTANPKLTVRSVSTTNPVVPSTSPILTNFTEAKEKVKVVERVVTKPVTADITAKILSITTEASAKFNAAVSAASSGSAVTSTNVSTTVAPTSVVSSVRWNGKVEPASSEGKVTTKLESAKTIFFSPTKNAEEVGKVEVKKATQSIPPPSAPKSAPVIPDKKPQIKVRKIDQHKAGRKLSV